MWRAKRIVFRDCACASEINIWNGSMIVRLNGQTFQTGHKALSLDRLLVHHKPVGTSHRE